MRTLVALLSAALLSAGCASADPEAAPSTSASAPEPAVDAETGSIAGTVVDEEQKPLVGADVSVQNQQPVKTDAQGAFTVNGLEPGTHNVFVILVGYNQGAKKVDVIAGEITTVQFVLAPIVVVDAYHESFTKTGMVTGQYTVNIVQNMVNHTQVDQLLCQCVWLIELKPNILDAVTDVYFKPSVTAPSVNEIIIVVYNKSLEAGQTVSTIMSGEFDPNGETRVWSENHLKNLKGTQKARLQLHGPDPDNPGIAFQQRVDLWQTWAWGEPLPEGFTMLPPK